MRSALFWDITQHRVVVLYRRFGRTYRAHLQGTDLIYIVAEAWNHAQIALPKPRRDWRVGLADRQRHCAVARNVCSSAVYEIRIRGMKDGLGVRIYNLWNCTLCWSRKSESRRPPVNSLRYILKRTLIIRVLCLWSTTSHSRRLECAETPLWEPEISQGRLYSCEEFLSLIDFPLCYKVYFQSLIPYFRIKDSTISTWELYSYLTDVKFWTQFVQNCIIFVLIE
jgi:hypothetical protein